MSFMTFTEEGLVLGAGTVLAKRRRCRALALDGAEERLLALLASPMAGRYRRR